MATTSSGSVSSSVSGISSGIDWKTLVDQLISADRARSITPIEAAIETAKSKQSIWSSLGTTVGSLAAAARTIADPATIAAYAATVSPSSGSGRTLLSALASAAAQAGSYEVGIDRIATAAKLGGTFVTDPTTSALAVSGDVVIDGRKVSLAAGDSLNVIRDKINAVNGGASASRVSATVLSTGVGQSRLVLTAQDTGAQGMDLIDSPTGVLRALGLVDGTTQASLAASGAAQSARFTSATGVLADTLGTSAPAATTILVGGVQISVDAATDSLNAIRDRIRLAGGDATVVSETTGGVTRYRLQTTAVVAADPADATTSGAALQALGFTTAGRGAVAQSVRTGAVLTDSATGLAATASAKLADVATGVADGDTITVRGTRADGSSVALTINVTTATTLQDVLNALNNTSDGFGKGLRPATAQVVNGQIALTDTVGGTSQLALAITANNEGNGTLSFGATSRLETGRVREIVAAQDAVLRVDGLELTRASNQVTDVIEGVTLSLSQAEIGATSTVTVSRDTSKVATAVQSLVDGYNALVSFYNTQRAADQPLAYNATLRASVQQFRTAVFNDVEGIDPTATYRTLGSIGVTVDKAGVMSLKQDTFLAALDADPAGVKRLLAGVTEGTTADVGFVAKTTKTQSGTYAVVVTQAASVASVVGAAFGTYADDGTPDTMTVADPTTGKSASVTLSTGDDATTIASRLNTMFQSNGLRLVADVQAGALRIQHKDAGTRAKFTVSYVAGGADGTAALGLAAGTYVGVDAVGTIGGHAATGNGNVLTGDVGDPAAPNPTAGLSVEIAMDKTGALGSVRTVLGIAGQIQRLGDLVTALGTGTVTIQNDSLSSQIDRMNTRIATLETRLAARQKALEKQFSAMEEMVAKFKGISSSLGGQWSNLSGNSSSNG